MPTIAAAFRDYQSTILDHLDNARTLLAGGHQPPRVQLDANRAAIAQAMDAYQTFKHRHVYDPVIAAGTQDAALATELRDDCLALGKAFHAYADAPPADLPGYRQATLAIADTITRALIREFGLVQQLRIYRDLADRTIGD